MAPAWRTRQSCPVCWLLLQPSLGLWEPSPGFSSTDVQLRPQADSSDPWLGVLEQPWVPGFRQGHAWPPGTFCYSRAPGLAWILRAVCAVRFSAGSNEQAGALGSARKALPGGRLALASVDFTFMPSDLPRGVIRCLPQKALLSVAQDLIATWS